MESSDAIRLIVLLILLGLSAFFSSAETAMTTFNRLQIKSLSEEGNRRAALLTRIVQEPGKLLSTILIGNNIVNIFASSLVTILAIDLFGNAFVGAATGVFTLMVLLFGEITPKTLATYSSEKMALAYAPIIYVLMTVMTPVIAVVNAMANVILRVLRVDPNAKPHVMTEMELRTLLEVGHEDGVIEPEEKEMINNVFGLDDSNAKDIMTPRIDMTVLDVECTYEELLDTFREVEFTRYPVYEESPDHIVGTINVKDLIMMDPEERDSFSIRSILREPYFTYEHKHISDLLVEMREQSNNFAIVLDEYGSVAGLLTLEDILEEIVGEIRDEYDESEQEMLTEVTPGREYIALGSAKLDDIDEALSIDLESEEYDSIGGFIIEQLDRLPEKDETLRLENGIRLTVNEIANNRIEKVFIRLPLFPQNEEKED